MKNQALQKLGEDKRAAYAAATEAASRIAALKTAGAPAAQVQEAVTRFKTLLWGPASITESRDVRAALALFNGALDGDADASQLQQLSLDLAHVCGNETHDVAPVAGRADSAPDFGPNSAILAQMREVTRGPEAQQAAGQWLALVDAEQICRELERLRRDFSKPQFRRNCVGTLHRGFSQVARRPGLAQAQERGLCKVGAGRPRWRLHGFAVRHLLLRQE